MGKCYRKEVHAAVLGVGFRVLGVKGMLLEEVVWTESWKRTKEWGARRRVLKESFWQIARRVQRPGWEELHVARLGFCEAIVERGKWAGERNAVLPGSSRLMMGLKNLGRGPLTCCVTFSSCMGCKWLLQSQKLIGNWEASCSLWIVLWWLFLLSSFCLILVRLPSTPSPIKIVKISRRKEWSLREILGC